MTGQDQFGDILKAMRVTGGIFLDAEFTAPWCVSSRVGPEDCGQFTPIEPRSVIAFHYVCEGRLVLVAGSEAPVVVEQGEIVVLPRNDEHRLGSDLGIPAVDADSLIQPGINGGLAHISHGAGGEKTSVVCGFLGTDRPNDPVLQMLPVVLTLKVEEGALGNWIESSFRLAAQEMAAGKLRSPDMLAKLVELLFVQAVQRFLRELPEESNRWCEGARDPKLAHALGLLHGRMRHRWTSEELAETVGMSRSAFADRFTRVLGDPPMRYLAKLRLQGAARTLSESDHSIARIAFDVGYESEAAFNRAFKREFGAPPSTWRKSRRAGHSETGSSQPR
jgi:AraC-like DNA-binding protein